MQLRFRNLSGFLKRIGKESTFWKRRVLNFLDINQSDQRIFLQFSERGKVAINTESFFSSIEIDEEYSDNSEDEKDNTEESVDGASQVAESFASTGSSNALGQ